MLKRLSIFSTIQYIFSLFSASWYFPSFFNDILIAGRGYARHLPRRLSCEAVEPFSCGNIVSIYPWQIVLISMPRCSSIFIVHISYGNPESRGGLRRRGNEASAVLKHMYQTVRGRHRRAVRRERIICADVYSPDRKSTLTVGRSGICAE